MGDRGRRRSAAALLLVGALSAGCSSDDSGCTGSSYHPDLDHAGEETPIDALNAWLGTDPDLPMPPGGQDWTQQDRPDDADRAVLTNEAGDGWWVVVARTRPGGWVVSEATADASGCDDLPGP